MKSPLQLPIITDSSNAKREISKNAWTAIGIKNGCDKEAAYLCIYIE